MSQFFIEFDPEICVEIQPYEEGFVENTDFGLLLSKLPSLYRAKYVVNGKTFEYIPSTLITLLNDFHWEWSLMDGGVDHDITLVGYAILHVKFDGGVVYVSNPAELNDVPKPWIVALETTQVKNAIKCALDKIYSMIICELQ